jgi:hypothetical protein
MPHDPTVIPIMRGRRVLVAERYGTPSGWNTSSPRLIDHQSSNGFGATASC